MAEGSSNGGGGTTVLLLLALGAGVLFLLKSKSSAPRPADPATQIVDAVSKITELPFDVGAKIGDKLGFGASDKANKIATAVVTGCKTGGGWLDAVEQTFGAHQCEAPYPEPVPLPPGVPPTTQLNAIALRAGHTGFFR